MIFELIHNLAHPHGWWWLADVLIFGVTGTFLIGISDGDW